MSNIVSPPFCYQIGVVTTRLYTVHIYVSRRNDKEKYIDKYQNTYIHLILIDISLQNTVQYPYILKQAMNGYKGLQVLLSESCRLVRGNRGCTLTLSRELWWRIQQQSSTVVPLYPQRVPIRVVPCYEYNAPLSNDSCSEGLFLL